MLAHRVRLMRSSIQSRVNARQSSARSISARIALRAESAPAIDVKMDSFTTRGQGHANLTQAV